MKILNRPCSRLLAAALLAAPALGQGAESRSAVGEVPATAPAFAPEHAFPPQRGPEIDAGAGRLLPVIDRDDSVPLPEPPVASSNDDGDSIVRPAGGDPYFLGFVAGPYYPPAGESVDPALVASVQAQPIDGRGASRTFAFAMFSKRITPRRVARLEELGCRVLGFHPHHTMKIAVPSLAIDSVAALDFIRWVGVARDWQKVHPRLLEELESWPAGAPADVYVNVFESDLGPDTTYTPVGSVAEYGPDGTALDAPASARASTCMSNGWQQLALEQAGVEVLEYVDTIRAFRARILPGALEEIAGLDFVQFVEANLPDDLAHDESMPMTLMDYTRQDYDGNDSLVAAAGQIDSGVDIGHPSLNHFYSVGWDSTGEGAAITDNCEHGTHVAGTILGLPGVSNEGLVGCAPGLGSSASRRFFNVKKHDGSCISSSTSLSTLFGHMRTDFTDTSGNTSDRPHAINNSWGSVASAGSPFVGSEADCRTVDAEVWDHSQLYVFAAGNEGATVGDQSIREEGSAKNALTVGSIADFADGATLPGEVVTSSSRGPTGDGRWKPNLCAPGRLIRSANANNTTFIDKSGTSMASPHVTGLAAQLVDHYSSHRYKPHRLAAVMMATAIADQDDRLTTQAGIDDDHLNSFGAGRINAANAHWVFGGVTSRSTWTGSLNSGQWGFSDFTIDAGCQRVIVLVTYHEDQCSAGASQALVSDFDLYIDSPTGGIDPAGNTGEYFAHQSSVDNTEIRTISSPQTGTWRWKVYPTSATDSIRYSVVVQQIFDDTTPNGSLVLSADEVCVQPNDDVQITATVDNPQYFASNVFLDSNSVGDVLQASTTTHEDGRVTDLTANQTNGRDVMLGSIRTNQDRSATWTTRWATEGVKTWSVDAESDNWIDESQSIQITVDGTPPVLGGAPQSTSHTGVWSNDSSIDLQWNPATDALSGVEGYSWSLTPTQAMPDTTVDTSATSITVGSGDGTWYFSLRPGDACGNWYSGYTWAGPFRIDTVPPLGPSAFTSTSHTAGVLSCNENVELSWVQVAETHSGLAGYVAVVNQVPNFTPSGAPNVGPTETQATVFVPSSPNARYAHIRAVDGAGNLGATHHFGPILVNTSTVTPYCTGKVNSLGCTPTVGWTGSTSKSVGDFTVVCTNVISQKNGIMFWGRDTNNAAFQGGVLCVKSPLKRTPIQSSGGLGSGDDCSGSYAFTFDLAYTNAEMIDPGDTIYAQFWMRDPASPSTTGLSNALEFTLCE